MWRESLLPLMAQLAFFPPAEPVAIARAEAALDIVLPEDLRSFLLETDGLDDITVEQWPQRLVWPIARIVEQNLQIRADPVQAAHFMPFDNLLFFADVGVDGILLAFRITAANEVVSHHIMAWYPIEDSRPVVAYSLRDYLTRWLSGKLKF